MTFHPPTNRRERVLVYGPPGAGKSTDYLSIADLFWRTSTNQRLWLWDSDATWEAIRPVDGHLDQFINAVDLAEYDDWRNEAKTIKSRVNPNREDWLVVDMADSLYAQAKRRFFQRAYGQDYDEFFIDVAQMNPGKVGGSYGVNHHMVNEMYDAVFSVIHRFPGHVFCICQETNVWMPDEKTGKGGEQDAVIKSLYEKVGKKPGGRDNISHAFHTVIRQVEVSEGRYLMQGMKDRQREKVKGVVVPKLEDGGFALAYLMRVAGWVAE